MDNLSIYNSCREVPQDAQKLIGGGRLKGMTDINPMWRIKKLTELFGPVGFGWYTEITERFIETSSTGEATANIFLNLYVKMADVWSKPIPGIGGSMFVAKEKNGAYTCDEAYKMAYTDAISVACKALGMGADVYYQKDRTKYDPQAANTPERKALQEPQNIPEKQNADAGFLPNTEKIDEALISLGKAKTKADIQAIWNAYKRLDDGRLKPSVIKRAEEISK